MKTLQNPLYCSYLLKKIAWFSKKSNATIIAGMVLLIFNTMSGFAAITKPTITSFSPTSAKPGDAVTLTGSGFNITAASNIVFFGATRAIVTNATATSVTVTVPTGATYAPISLLNTGTVLSGSSLSNFNPVYAPAKTNITSKDFSPKEDFTTEIYPYSVAIGDLDGDGKPDLAVANQNSLTVSVFRNTSASGSIAAGSFAAKVDFATGSGPTYVAIGDLDGDGKPDLAVGNYSSASVSVLRNTSASGSIVAGSFAAKVDFTTGTSPWFVAIGDLDGDGKPDLAVANYSSNTVSVLRNTSASGSITTGSFAAKVDFTTRLQPTSVAIGDLDGDGKPDLAVANRNSDNVSVIRNTSTSGSITTGSFAAKVNFTTGTNPTSVAIGDLDGDGKPDLAVANSSSASVSVFLNTSASGSIAAGSFAAKVDFTTGDDPESLAIGDLDGDGKPDLAVANQNSLTVSVLRNTSTSGSIVAGSFAAKVDFTTGNGPASVAIGDLDGDGKPDLAVANFSSASVSVLRNVDCLSPTAGGTIAAAQSGASPFNPDAFTSSSAASGDYYGGALEYKWQSSTTSSTAGFSDIVSSNSAVYEPGSLTQTTWFKRLARVDCKSDWTEAVESNVLLVNLGCTPTTPQPAIVNCWDNFVFNTTTCVWDNTGVQPVQPAIVNCWDNFVFNTTTCVWDNTGTQPVEPTKVNCWDNFVFNTETCGDWYNTGVQPVQPEIVNCWDNFVFNTTSCVWDNIGTQPAAPTGLACYQTATWNSVTCQWDVTGTQSERPNAVNCWDNYQFNTVNCIWENTGTQPVKPNQVNCWDNYQFNTDNCVWENTGTQPVKPNQVNCWDNFVFNTTSCVWDNTGVQPVQPAIVNCWDNFVFNTTTCVWDNTGIQPATPWYKDNDGDGYGDPNSSTLDCDQPEGYVSNSRDCNDSNDKIGIKYWHKDKDGDGHGSRRDEDRRESCSKPQNDGSAGEYVENADDCDDDDASIGNTIWYKDADADGYGTGDTLMVCDQPAGYRLLSAMTAATGDCDDTNANIRPNSSTAATSATSSVINPALGTSLKLRKVGGLLGANDTWKWYTSSCGGTLVGTGESITVAPTVTTTYYVRAEGCTNTNCVSVTVTICGPTGVTSNVANNTICQGISAQLNVQGSLVGSAKWVWYKNGCGYNESSRSSESSIGTGSSLKVTPSSTTTYFVRSEGGTCGKTICKSITIVVNSKPSKPTTVSTPKTICKQTTAVFTVGDVATATSYQWTVPSGWTILSGQGTKTVSIITGKTSSEIKVSAVNACGSSDAFARKVTISTCGTDNLIPVSSVGKKIVGDQLENTGLLVEAEPHETTFSIFPNPAVNEATVSINYPVTGEGVLQLTDALGKKISNTKISLMPGQNYYGINTTGLDQGLYIVRFIGEKGSRTVRFVVAR